MAGGYWVNPSSKLGTVNNVSVATSTVAVASNAFGSETFQIRISSPSACFFKVGDGTPTAAATDAYLPANWVEYIKVTPGQKVSVNTATGTPLVSVIEVTN